MKKDYFKYLIIPSISTLLYAFISVTYAIYRINNDTISEQFKHLVLLNHILSILYFLPIVFIPVLVFTVAYKLTQLTIRNINYAILISLALFLLNLISTFFISYITNLFGTYEYRNYLTLFFNYYSMSYPLIMGFIIVGVSTLYISINKYPIMPTTNKKIGLIYATLFLVLSLTQPLCMLSMNFIFRHVSLQIIICILLACIIVLGIYFIYCYTWFKETLHTNKITTHYPTKTILSCLLMMLMLLAISVLLNIIVLKIPVLLYSINFRLSEAFIKGAVVASYLISIFLFFILYFRSQSLIYRVTHIAYYVLATITPIVVIAWFTPSYRFKLSYLSDFLYIFGNLYGFLLLGLSVSLGLFYLCNKFSINLIFKNKQLFQSKE